MDKESSCLVEKHKGLAKDLVLQMNNIRDIDLDDFFQIAYCSLDKSIKLFDRNRNFTFSTFATTVIRNDLMKYYKRKYKQFLNDDNIDNHIFNYIDPNIQERETIIDFFIISKKVNLSSKEFKYIYRLIFKNIRKIDQINLGYISRKHAQLARTNGFKKLKNYFLESNHAFI